LLLYHPHIIDNGAPDEFRKRAVKTTCKSCHGGCRVIVAATVSQLPKSLNTCEVLTSNIEGKGIFEKIVLNQGCIVQYQGVNVPPSKIGFIHQAVKFGKSVEKFKD